MSSNLFHTFSEPPKDCSKFAISVKNLSKNYVVYDSNADRLKHFFLSPIRRLMGKECRTYFREFRALDNVSFEVKKGESVGIIGRNGAGKSTLLQMICETVQPTGGCIDINGRIAALLELGSGFNPDFSGRENIYINASILGLDRALIDARFSDIEAFADIGDYIDQPVKKYSSGMIMRLAFAVIAHVDADILIIDEALSVGDAFFTQKCMRFLREFMKDGTVLFVSHDIGAVLGLCNSALFLKDGMVVEAGDPQYVTECYLEEQYKVIQGDSVVEGGNKSNKLRCSNEVKTVGRDMRLDFIQKSNLRNDIQIFPMEEGTREFGDGGAILTDVLVLDKNRTPLSWVVGGEEVTLAVRGKAQKEIYEPIVGFTWKDRLGQIVFCDNTYLSYKDEAVAIKQKQNFEACFNFVMPVLPVGDYVISAAIAEGTPEAHVQHHWIHEALVMKVHSTSVCYGLIGLPLLGVNIHVFDN